MQIDFIYALIMKKTRAVLMLTICHLIYVLIYVGWLKMILYALQHDLCIKAYHNAVINIIIPNKPKLCSLWNV